MSLKKITLAAALGVLSTVAFGAAVPNHLLLTEVAVSGGKYTSGGTTTYTLSSEYTEIYNPTSTTVNDLQNYYLTDWSRYWDLPYVSTYDPTNFPREGGGDFIVRFPNGTSLAPGQIVVVTANAQYFIEAYFGGSLSAFTSQPGSPQLFEIQESRSDVPNMVDLNLDSIEEPRLLNQSHSDAGENVFLFYWNGLTDLVQDVDIVMYADERQTLGTDNGIFPKSGVPSDGPDPDTDLTSYLNDAGSEANLAVRNNSGVRFSQIARRSIFEIGEVLTGGNGITGSDATTERNNVSWVGFPDTDATATPGVLPPSLTAADKAPVLYASRTTLSPLAGQPVRITVKALDDGSIASASIIVNSGTTSSPVAMQNIPANSDTWVADLGPYPAGTTVKWLATVTDNTGNTRSELDYKHLGSTFQSHTFRVVANEISENDLIISEISFDPEGTDNAKYAEWCEIYNSRTTPIDMSGFLFAVNSNDPYVLPEGSIIPGQGYFIISPQGILFKNHDYPRYDSTGVFDLNYTGISLFTNGSSTLYLYDLNSVGDPGAPLPAPIDVVKYNTVEPFPVGGASGTSRTLELKNYKNGAVDNNDGANWAASPNLGGSPGRPNVADNTATVNITGGLRNIQFPTSSDVITFNCNATGDNALSNVQLVYDLNDGTGYKTKPMIKGAGTAYSTTLGPLPSVTRIKYYIKAIDNVGNVAYQPYAFPWGFFVDDNPVTDNDIVVNEVMYNPRGTDGVTTPEWIELYNRRSTPVDLSFYGVGRGTDEYYSRVLSEGTIIPAKGFLVLNGRTELMLKEYPALDPNGLYDLQWPNDNTPTGTPPKNPNRSLLTNSTGDSARQIPVIHANSVVWGSADPVIWGKPQSVPFDYVSYETADPSFAGTLWPTNVTDGYSIELIDPSFPNSVGSSWLRSAIKGGSPLAQNGVSSDVVDWSMY